MRREEEIVLLTITVNLARRFAARECNAYSSAKSLKGKMHDNSNPVSSQPTIKGLSLVALALAISLFLVKFGLRLRSDILGQMGFVGAITLTGVGVGYSALGRAGIAYGLVLPGLTYVIAGLILSAT